MMDKEEVWVVGAYDGSNATARPPLASNGSFVSQADLALLDFFAVINGDWIYTL